MIYNKTLQKQIDEIIAISKILPGATPEQKYDYAQEQTKRIIRSYTREQMEKN